MKSVVLLQAQYWQKVYKEADKLVSVSTSRTGRITEMVKAVMCKHCMHYQLRSTALHVTTRLGELGNQVWRGASQGYVVHLLVVYMQIDKGVAPSVVLKLVLVTAQHQQEKKLEGHRELLKKLHGQAEAVKQHNTDRDSCLLNELKALRKATKKSSLSEILSSVHKLFGVKK